MAVVGISSSCIYRAHQDYTNFRILDALHLALIIHCVYFYLVINCAIMGALTEIVWSSKVSRYFPHKPLLSYCCACAASTGSRCKLHSPFLTLTVSPQACTPQVFTIFVEHL
jgi:hypothetical protein